MSAIWGAIDFSGKEIPEETKIILKSAFDECAIDKTTELSSKNVYMACGLQYFTAESRNEKLPCEENGVFYTADAVLDNRKEMCEKLGISESPDLPDGEIIRRCFDKFGRDCLNDLLGAYVFVRFDSSAGRVDIVGDAVGNRFIQYFIEDGILYFSSLRAPLEKLKKEVRLNKKWLAYYFAVNSLDTFCDCESTIIEGIDRIAPATHIVIDNGKITEKHLYWDVTVHRRTKHPKSDDEYRKEFLDLFRKCVKETLRTDEEVAILLSGGYDSTAVACLAAPLLKEKGKKLYSFTSVPKEDFVYDGPRGKEANEFASVKRNMEFLGNVECSAISVENVDLWEARKEYNKVSELPYKSPENMIWLYKGYKMARAKGARIVLSGAFGNGTISYNNLLQYLVWLVKNFKFKRYIEEINAFNKKYDSSRKNIIKQTWRGIRKKSMPSVVKFEVYKECYAPEAFLEEYGAIERVKKDEANMKKSYHDAERYHSLFLPPINFRHYGEFSFKNSLYAGILFRDPTRDRRMIEFVKTVPYDQFTHNGYTRRLVADYMKDIMPPNFFIKHPTGVQSADMQYRFKNASERIIPMWKEIVSKLDGKGIIDNSRILDTLNQKDVNDYGNGDIMRLFYTINALEYINNYEL